MNLKVRHIALLLATAVASALLACGGGSGTATSPTTGVSGIHSAYVINAGGNSISEYAIDTKGVLHEIKGSPLAVSGGNPLRLIMTPNGKFLYALDKNKSTIFIMSIDANTGVLSTVGSQPTGPAPSSMTIDPKSQFLYLGNTSAATISVYAIGTDGKLTEAAFSPVAVGDSVADVKVSPKGTYLFASVPNTGALYEFAADATTGALTPVAGSPFTVGTNPGLIAVSPDESFAIVVDISNVINRVNIGAGGALSIAPNSPFIAGTNPVAVAIDSTNAYVYLVNQPADHLTTIGFQAGGAPYQVSQAPTGVLPTAMAISASNIYVTNQSDNTVIQYSVAAGVATALSPSTVTTGSAPSSIAVR